MSTRVVVKNKYKKKSKRLQIAAKCCMSTVLVLHFHPHPDQQLHPPRPPGAQKEAWAPRVHTNKTQSILDTETRGGGIE